MAKNSVKQIEEDEKKILRELVNNSNKSINEIANKCSFSRQKVWRIIKNLERNHTIWGYTTIVNEEKQDMKSYTILIKRNNQPMKKEPINKIVKREIEQTAEKINVHIDNSLYVHGLYDWLIYINAPNTKEAKKFTEALTNMYSGIISDIQLLETLFTVKKNGITNPEIENLRDFFNGI